METSSEALSVTYVLPIRRASVGPVHELSDYLNSLVGVVDEIIVVDGSPEAPLDEFRGHLSQEITHMRPQAPKRANGKVAGVITGVRASRNERVVIADDDVRYDASLLEAVTTPLSQADLVRPQNYFIGLPWHAKLDSARSMLNRTFTGDRLFPAGDFPGTFAVSRSAFLRVEAYDGDVLFENLELMRTMVAGGGTVRTSLGIYVPRIPPSTSRFWSQRVRQAYDDLAIPVRFAAFLAVLPSVAWLLKRRQFRILVLSSLGVMATAETGRQKAGGTDYFPPAASLLAPAWLLERGFSVWLALGQRLRGGVVYNGRTIKLAANSLRTLTNRRRGGSSAF